MPLAVALLACLCCGLVFVIYRQRHKQQESNASIAWLEAECQQNLEEAKSKHDQFIETLNSLSEGVLLSDSNGHVIFRNNAAHAFTQTRHGNALVEATIQEQLAESRQGKATKKEIQLYGPPDQTLMLHTSPLSNKCALAVIEDISHLLRHEIIRRDLVTNIGHELRTPVGALSVLADAMQNETDSKILLSLSESIGKESIRLTQIVEDLLELSQLEQSLDQHTTVVVMQDVIRRAITRVSGVATQNGTELRVELEAEPVCVIGDSFQLTSAVYNLLENAIKYSESNLPVHVSLTNSNGKAEIAVRDKGFGISRRDQDRVFERFYRVDYSRSSAAGSGLGLSLVRHVALRHDGEITLESEEGVGSTFTIRLPACASPEYLESHKQFSLSYSG